MAKTVFSICIPAFKRTLYLTRLLDSIVIQSYRDFEVIITDDSPGDEVNNLCNLYQDKFILHYFRNKEPLGTPENWNEAIRNAKGEWIKLMHDDDWFIDQDSLLAFKKMIDENPQKSFFYSAYQNVYEEDGRIEKVFVNSYRKMRLEKNPVALFSSNVIGPPSVTLIRNDNKEWYDRNIKWLVDIDYYIRYLRTGSPVYTGQLLVNVGINNEQVTKSSFRVGNIEIPESFYLFGKLGIQQLKDILVYDAWWRLLRNLGIRSVEDITKFNYKGAIHPVIRSMVRYQSFIPAKILRLGMCSKLVMIIHYLLHRSALR
ncbi:MAG: glycosyltransferase [Chitinophagaceae bacterium]|nr:glycosyltransferase [Chitinophagaceae bacterium]